MYCHIIMYRINYTFNLPDGPSTFFFLLKNFQIIRLLLFNFSVSRGDVMFTWQLVCLHNDHHVYMKNIMSTWRCNNEAIYTCSKHDMSVGVCIIRIIHTAWHDCRRKRWQVLFLQRMYWSPKDKHFVSKERRSHFTTKLISSRPFFSGHVFVCVNVFVSNLLCVLYGHHGVWLIRVSRIICSLRYRWNKTV